MKVGSVEEFQGQVRYFKPYTNFVCLELILVYDRNGVSSSYPPCAAAQSYSHTIRSSRSASCPTRVASMVSNLLQHGLQNFHRTSYLGTVAVTRAQALLIVIGDASVLSIDPLWRGFMNYVYHHHGWRGDPPAWDVNAPVLEDADYAKEIREAAAADMDAFMVRVAAGEDVEGEANVDVAFQGAD